MFNNVKINSNEEFRKKSGWTTEKPKCSGYFEYLVITKSRYVKKIKIIRSRSGVWYLEYSHEKPHDGYPGSFHIKGIETKKAHLLLQTMGIEKPDYKYRKVLGY